MGAVEVEKSVGEDDRARFQFPALVPGVLAILQILADPPTVSGVPENLAIDEDNTSLVIGHVAI